MGISFPLISPLDYLYSIDICCSSMLCNRLDWHLLDRRRSGKRDARYVFENMSVRRQANLVDVSLTSQMDSRPLHHLTRFCLAQHHAQVCYNLRPDRQTQASLSLSLSQILPARRLMEEEDTVKWRQSAGNYLKLVAAASCSCAGSPNPEPTSN